MTYRLLDLCCCSGVASRGYRRAGFTCTGVDIEPQPNYPYEFILGDALDYLAAHGYEYDAIHVSPQCQGYSNLSKLGTYDPLSYPKLIAQFRALLDKLGKPYVIENVKGAYPDMCNPFELCGYTFGLKVYRHRLFESNLYIMSPHHIKHPEPCPPSGRGPSKVHGIISITGSGGAQGLTVPYMEYAKMAMGIDWDDITRHEISESIPPAYTEYIGKQLMSALSAGGGSQ